MYAVFEDGSRQYRVSEGEIVRVDFRDAAIGSRLEFNRILLYQEGSDTRLGQPLIHGARVLGEVVEHPSIKVLIQHFRRRKNSRRLKGHRQHYTSVKVQHILLPGQETPARETPPAPDAEAPGSGAPEAPAGA